MIYKLQQSKRGFVILFAVLISAIILLIGVGIFRITVKETILSSAARESMISFFAADGGLECALYEANVVAFGFLPGAAGSSLDCYNQSIVYPQVGGNCQENGAQTEFYIELPNNTCAFVEVDRCFKENVGDACQTQITSHGFNVCDGDQPDRSDPILLERVLELTYFDSDVCQLPVQS